MPQLIDFFHPDAFSLVSNTAAIQSFPTTYGRIGELGLFVAEPVNTNTVVIEVQNNTLNLLPTKPYDAPPTYGTLGRRNIRTFVIPHIPHDDRVYARDVAGVRSFGTDNIFMTVEELYARKLQTMKRKHDITLEHLRASALRGVPLDADGTELYDYYDQWGVTQQSQSFALTTSTTEVLNKVTALKRYFEQNLKGETMTGVHVLCSSGFFDAFIAHATVKDAYKYFAATQAPLRDDLRSGFNYGGVVFEEYVGSASDIDGNVRLFVPTDEAIAFPMGTQNVFRTIYAPSPTYAETVNTMGQPLYARSAPDPLGLGRWIDILTEQNPLPMVKRPDLLVRLTKT